LRAELDNLRNAVTWALERDSSNDVELGIAIVAALASQAFHHEPTISTWAERASDHLEATSAARRATVLPDDHPLLVELEAQLGTERYRAAREQGATLSFDEVVVLVLGALDRLEVPES
jgi:hypothetical protein